MKNNHTILIAIIVILFFSGCVENAETINKAVTYSTNQDVMDELTIHMDQFTKSGDTYKEALDNYNEAINNYNDFIYEYNDMSYFQRTSSSTINKKSSLESEYKSAARDLIVQCEVMETQIDDILVLIEVNKEIMMELDSKSYLELKSTLTEAKATVKINKAGATEMLYK